MLHIESNAADEKKLAKKVAFVSPFADEATADIADGTPSKKARKALPVDLRRLAQRKLLTVLAATSVEDLRLPPGNGLEALKDDREGQHSIRINEKHRICFVMTDTGAMQVEIVDYH